MLIQPPRFSAPCNVLVVDDDVLVQHLAVAILRGLGHSGIVVGNGQAAIDCLATHKFDLVLMDVTMPVLDGLATLARLRQAEAEQSGASYQRIVMMTAHDAPGDVERLRQAGADGHITKPLERQQFAREVARVLAT